MSTLLHDRTRIQLEALTASGAASVIFHGRSGMGKFRAAHELADNLNCHKADKFIIAPVDKPSISIEQIRGLVPPLSLSLTSPNGGRVVIIDQADVLTVEAQNALLKLIEEPPRKTTFVLVAAQLERLLPTVRSRCATIYFPRFPRSELAGWLTGSHNLKPAIAARLAAAADGIPGLALDLSANPGAVEAELELRQLADSIPTLRLFQRLLLAKKLVDSKTDLAKFGQLIHQNLVKQVRDGAQPDPRQFTTLEHFRLALSAKVSSRVALEQLMVEY
jgi:DNA polymerase III delta prime subunit